MKRTTIRFNDKVNIKIGKPERIGMSQYGLEIGEMFKMNKEEISLTGMLDQGTIKQLEHKCLWYHNKSINKKNPLYQDCIRNCNGRNKACEYYEIYNRDSKDYISFCLQRLLRNLYEKTKENGY